MAVGEVFLGAFLQVLFDRLASGAVRDYLRQFAGISASELKKWETRLRMMDAVLIDADEKQLYESAVKIWLDDLQDLAYDVEDILDELATEAARRELKLKNRSKFCNAVTVPFSKLKFNRDMAARIEGITSRLDELCELKDKLRLVSSVGASSSLATSASQRTPTTCLPPEYDIGRDDEKQRILESLLKDDSGRCDSNYQVVSIVGLGGIGKTTLAQNVYNHNRVEKNFELRVWVCVSLDYDVTRISKAILESLTSSSCDLKELNEVQLKLREQLRGKKFMVVLDDVWGKDYDKWLAMSSVFAAGAPGSKIIVTTRDMGVAATMGSMNRDERFELNCFSDNESWSIFKKHAFVNEDTDPLEDLKAIREKVVKRCGGLPLAARTLGGLLRSKQRCEWEGILNNKIWDPECDILPVLRLSYQYLPAHLKRCFAYCAIFPQDYEFKEMEIILLWMAEGLIPKSQSGKEMEDLGKEFFQDLLSRSIFQKKSRNDTCFVMHDLVNDLARSVSGETSFKWPEDATKGSRNIERARHSSYYVSRMFECDNHFEIWYKNQHLRTVLAYVEKNVTIDLFANFKRLMVLNLKRLRVLFLNEYREKGFELPDSIKHLIHLRYLNLQCTWIRRLPDSTCLLLNLQTLILQGCELLIKLPAKMKDLVDLRYLDIRRTSLIAMPIGMERLTSLRNLPDFIVGYRTGSNLKDLKNLKFLRGELCISRLENADDIQETILNEMKDLKVLKLRWTYRHQMHGEDNRMVLDILQPHTNLEELTIQHYCSTSFSPWVGYSSFKNMKSLTLINCDQCTSLPSLGNLVSLKKAFILGMNGVRSISSEIYGNSLEILEFDHLENWEHWYLMQENGHVSKRLCLRELTITFCPKLSESLPRNLTSLEELDIAKCDSLSFIVKGHLPACLKTLRVSSCEKLQGILDDKENVDGLPSSSTSSLEDLYIYDCPSLTCLFTSGMLPTTLKHLETLDCQKLELIAERFYNNTLLEYISICGCHNLKSIPDGLQDLNSLIEIVIKDCPSLVSFPQGGLPSNISKIHIIDCDNLEALPDGFRSLNFLQGLTLEKCPRITLSLEERLPTSLTALKIGGEDICKPFIKWGLHKLTTLKTLKIGDVEDAVSFPEEETFMSSLPSLTHLSICSFPNMKHLSRRGFAYLPYLRSLAIENCPKLESFPKEGLPSLELYVYSCPLLKERCKRDEGPEWNKIAHMTYVRFWD